MDGVEVKRGEQTDQNTPKTLIYESESDDVVTISLGNVNNSGSSSAGIRIYDVILVSWGIGSDYDSNYDGDGDDGGDNNNDGDDDDGDDDDDEEDISAFAAFPGAEGYGSRASGGRGGKVVAVTTLADSGTGSLRWALDQYPGEPLTVVFQVSGIIELQSELRKKRDNFTLAGQTSPGGICIVGHRVNLGGSNNVIIRHLRFRIGEMSSHPDGLGSIGYENASNFIIDHCTFGWSAEENMTVYDNKRTTVQWCIVHEGLYDAGHGKGVRGYGSQWGGATATYHHNLLAHNYSRSPRFNGARNNDRNVLLDYVNNVNYNWGKRNAAYGAEVERNTHRVNFVNNYYKPGPAFPGTSASDFVESYFTSAQQSAGKTSLWYMDGNVMEGTANTARNTDNYSGLDAKGLNIKSATPFEVRHPVTTETAADAFTSVLAGAGAFPRDSVDARIVQEARNGTATYGKYGDKSGIINKPSDVGGYPTYISAAAPADTDRDGIPDDWETANGLNPNDSADGNLTNLSGGTYTNLEVYLNSLAAALIE